MAYTPDVLKATAEQRQLRFSEMFGSMLSGLDAVQLAAVQANLSAQGLPTTAALMEDLNVPDHGDTIEKAFAVVFQFVGTGLIQPQHDFGGTLTVDANLDSADGFSAGSIVIDASNDVYICQDPTATSAVWIQIN